MTFSTKYGSGDSKYCYPGTEILINKLNIKDAQLLDEADTVYSAQRLLELQADPIKGNFNLKHLKNFQIFSNDT